MVMELPLTRGLVALVDDDEYPRCAKYNWSANPATNGKFYAARGIWDNDKYYRIFLHRFILGFPDGIRIDHIDGDPLNCRLVNLRAATAQQNNWNKTPTYSKRESNAGTYSASLSVNGVVKALGTYHTREEAIAIEDAARVLTRGAFARTINSEVPPSALQLVERILDGESPPNAHHKYSESGREERSQRNRAIRERYAAGNIYAKELVPEFGLSLPRIQQILRTPVGDDGLQVRINGILKYNRGAQLRALAIVRRQDAA